MRLKPVEQLSETQLFDELTALSYYGTIFRNIIRKSPRAKQACRDLLAELRQDDSLRDNLFQTTLCITSIEPTFDDCICTDDLGNEDKPSCPYCTAEAAKT